MRLSFANKVILTTWVGVLLVMAPVTYFLMEREKGRVEEEIKGQVETLSSILSSPLTNLLILSNELEMELTVAQLKRKPLFTFVGISNEQGIFVVHSDPEQKGRRWSEFPGEVSGLLRGPQGYMFVQPLRFSGKTVGFLVFGLNARFFEEPLRERQRLFLFAIGGTLALASFSVGVLVLLLLRPVKQVQFWAKEIAAGNFSLTLKTRRRDEIGDLIRSLNEMSQALFQAQETRIRNRVMERELEIAKEIQSALIPEEIQPPPYLELETFFQPAREVGGDFYYSTQGKSQDYFVLIADVSGKGVGSALLGSQVQGMFAALLKLSPHPKTAVLHIHKLLRAQSPSGLYCTLLLLRITPDLSVTLVNAGHPSPILIRAQGHEILGEGGSLALGVGEMKEFEDALELREFQLRRGDLLALYSDGVTEAMNARGEMWGEERWVQTLRNLAALPLSQGSKMIAEKIREFSGGAPQSDDLTWILLRPSPEPVIV